METATTENGKSLVVKSNSLVLSKSKLSASEQKLILKVISMINREDEDFKEYKIKISEYLKLVGSNSFNYQEVKSFAENLMKKPLKIPLSGGKDFLVCNWFSSVRYYSNEGILSFRFDPHLKPFLLQLKSFFTSYQLENVLKISNKYSIRLYEILKCYSHIGTLTIDIDEFKSLLSIPDTYDYASIKKRILLPSKEQIQEHTDISFNFKEIKDGKKVKSINFVIQDNMQYQINRKEINQKNNDEKDTENNLDVESIAELLPEKFRTLKVKRIIREALTQFSYNYVKEQVKYTIIKNPENFVAYLKRAIEEDYASIHKEEEKLYKKMNEELEKLENEKEIEISSAIEGSKIKIYEEYMSILDENERNELKKQMEKEIIEKNQDAKNNPYLLRVLTQKELMQKIIDNNEIYQKRLEKVRKEISEEIEKKYEKQKDRIIMQYKYNAPEK